MFRRLLKTESVAIADQTLTVRYLAHQTLRGGRRYSAEIVLAAADRVILDDDSLVNLQTKAPRVAAAMLYSRRLFAPATAA
jgi:hypothetical protein